MKRIEVSIILLLATLVLSDQAAADAQETDKTLSPSISDTSVRQTQLQELWEATMNRSPDVQFLQQNNKSDCKRIFSQALLDAIAEQDNERLGPRNIFPGNLGLDSVFDCITEISQTTSDMKKEQQLQRERIVRMAANKLVNSYRDYLMFSRSLLTATQDPALEFRDMPQLTDPSKQLERDYRLRRAERNLGLIRDDIRRNRSDLVELAGPEAMERLDQEIGLKKQEFMDPVHAGNGTS
jgi:hypothetical protein